MYNSKLDKIEDKLDRIQEKVAAIDSTLSAQHVTLEEHSRRSKASEEAVAVLTEKLQPVLTHVAVMQLCGKILIGIAGSEITWLLIKKLFNIN